MATSNNDIADLLKAMGTDPGPNSHGVAAASGGVSAAPPKKAGLSRTTIIILVVLVVALLAAGVLAWRARRNAANTGMAAMIAQCPDPERRQDLQECDALLGQCRRPWVKDLLTRAISMSATPTGPSGGGVPGGDVSGDDTSPDPAVVHGGGDDDPLFD